MTSNKHPAESSETTKITPRSVGGGGVKSEEPEAIEKAIKNNEEEQNHSTDHLQTDRIHPKSV